jgi:hypothetical protein
MARIYTRLIPALIIALTFGLGAAKADTLNLVGGGTVTGSFVYDVTTNSVVSFNFTTTAGGGFGNEVFVGNAPYTNTSTASAIVLTNQNGDQVFGFDAVQANGEVDELDIVVACGGFANCVQNNPNAKGNSFAIAAGFPTCPNPGTSTGFCIASGLQNQVPGSLSGLLLSAGNFITVDPPPGATQYTIALAITPMGSVLTGDGSGGGGPSPVPEPSTVLLLGAGLGAVVILKLRS